MTAAEPRGGRGQSCRRGLARSAYLPRQAGKQMKDALPRFCSLMQRDLAVVLGCLPHELPPKLNQSPEQR
jgi:hypothetical protein